MQCAWRLDSAFPVAAFSPWRCLCDAYELIDAQRAQKAAGDPLQLLLWPGTTAQCGISAYCKWQVAVEVHVEDIVVVSDVRLDVVKPNVLQSGDHAVLWTIVLQAGKTAGDKLQQQQGLPGGCRTPRGPASPLCARKTYTKPV